VAKTTQQTQSNTAVQASPAAKFSKEDLVAAAVKVFKVQPEVMVGALRGVEEALTMEEATAKLQAFLTKPIK